jgi:predicted DNA-binding ribbon-helix-helix protein
VATVTTGQSKSQPDMHSTVIKRSVVLDGHKTSISLEGEFWKGLKEIAAARNTSLSDLVVTIDRERLQGNLSSTIRLFVLESFRERAERGKVEPHRTEHSPSVVGA